MTKKTIVQCDFDGTITHEDISFAILNKFAVGEWRPFLEEYKEGRLSVAGFNTKAFNLVKVDQKTQLDYVLSQSEFGTRKGFKELVTHCRQAGIDFEIVSNGLEYYIKAVLANLNMNRVPVHAAVSRFDSHGMEVYFTGPKGESVDDRFKEVYVDHFHQKGYRVVYVGNGTSDLAPARKADCIFATSDLRQSCLELKLKHTPFEDFAEVIDGLKELPAD